ncbi:MAG: hypothetical protein K6T83_20800 [Alicyclobacillus sp.]|nr:hypothetical protein [Alicyclobacillus sp.]
MVHVELKAAFILIIAVLVTLLVVAMPDSRTNWTKPARLLGLLVVGVVIAIILLKAYPSGTTPTKLI